MSYDVSVHCAECGYDLMHGQTNMTSNVAPIWRELGCEISEWSGKKAVEVLPLLQKALNEFASMDSYDRENLDSLKRGDGSWGKLEHAIEYLVRIRDACALQPQATLHVSH